MDYGEKENQDLDLEDLLGSLLRQAKRTLALGMLLVLAGAAVTAVLAVRSHVPMYEAYVSFTLRVEGASDSGAHSYHPGVAQQLAKTVPSVLNSSVLQERVKEFLHTDSLPAIHTDVMGSGVFTLRVQDPRPEWASDVLNGVLECFRQVADHVIGPAELVVLDGSGVPSEPVNPLTVSAALIRGAAAGGGIWAVAVLFLAQIRNSVHSEAELERLLNVRCMGRIPMARGKKPFREAVRRFRLRVEQELEKQHKKVVLISGAVPREGSTTVSVSLAEALAMQNKQVLLVDCDLCAPTLEQAMGLENRMGLAEYIAGEINEGELIRSTGVEGLFLIGGGVSGRERGRDMLAGERFSRLMQWARERYDYVILDTPACALVADASEIAAYADCGLLVVRQDAAPRDRIVEGARSLEESGLSLLGCVLNGASSREGRTL